MTTKAGELYTFYDEDDAAFFVVKVLVVDKDAVHARVFDTPFKSAPTEVETSQLEWFVGHTPLDHDVLAELKAVKIGVEAVTEDELEGYRIWKDEGGGVFH
jgi:hypothetical protein